MGGSDIFAIVGLVLAILGIIIVFSIAFTNKRILY